MRRPPFLLYAALPSLFTWPAKVGASCCRQFLPPGAPHGGGSEDPRPSGELPTVEPPHGEVGAQARGDGAPTSLCARQIRQRHIRSRGGHLRAAADGASSSNGVLPAPTAGRLLPRDRGAASIRSSMAAAMAPPHLPVRHRRASSRSRLGCRAPLLPAVAPPPSFAPHLSLPRRPAFTPPPSGAAPRAVRREVVGWPCVVGPPPLGGGPPSMLNTKGTGGQRHFEVLLRELAAQLFPSKTLSRSRSRFLHHTRYVPVRCHGQNKIFLLDRK
jgi:hypothetical protein